MVDDRLRQDIAKMNRSTASYIVLSILLAGLVWTGSFALVVGTGQQVELKYQDRGDRYEGVRGSPVSDRVELISAVVNHKENDPSQLPQQFKMKIYLPGQRNVFVTVREIDNLHNYWMDKIKPPSVWHQGFSNDFAWPTGEVVGRLANLKLSDLGAIAQLDDNNLSPDIRVAPVILFYGQPPRTVGAYSFAFRISRKAHVTCSFYRDEGNDYRVLFEKQFDDMPGNRPRAVDWNVSQVKEGWYRLNINVIYNNNGQKVDQIVRFYHRPATR